MTIELKVKACTKTRPKDKPIHQSKSINDIDEDKVKPFLTIRKKKSKANEHYVSAKEFAEALQSYYDTEDDNCANYELLGTYFIKIAKGLSSSASFAGYSWKDDMICEALLKMTKALRGKKFSFKYGSSPFSYFTQIVYWAFIAEMKAEKKQHATIKKYRDVKYGEQFEGSDSNKSVYVKPDSGNEIFGDDF